MSARLESALAELAAAIREEAAVAAQPSPERLYTVDAACEAMGGVGRTLIYDLIARGELRSIRVGRRRLVPASSIAEFIGRPGERQ